MHSEAMSANHYFQAGGSHPYEHKLRLRSMEPYYRNSVMERALTVTNLQLAPRTTFEMERPITQASPRLVVINTSFRSTIHDRRPTRKRIPTFPELSTDAALKRKSNISRLTNSSMTTTNARMQSGNSSFRRERASASNRCGIGIPGSIREHSGNSDKRSGPGTHLTPRQSNTFTAYAKYNDIVNATKTREKASDLTITGNNNDLSALLPEKSALSSERMSCEKHLWIKDWVASTSAALRLDEAGKDENVVSKTLSVIQEN